MGDARRLLTAVWIATAIAVAGQVVGSRARVDPDIIHVLLTVAKVATLTGVLWVTYKSVVESPKIAS